MAKRNETVEGHGVTREGVDARVNNVLNDLEELVGKEIPCPICGHTSWTVYPNEMAVHFTELGADTGVISSLNAVALLCANCRFVRLHGMSTSEVLGDV